MRVNMYFFFKNIATGNRKFWNYLLFYIPGASVHEAEAASCHMREVDLCVATMLLSATEGVPATDEDIDKVCE